MTTCNQIQGKVVTKYQFSELLSKAWNKTMTPSTIINAGFNARVVSFHSTQKPLIVVLVLTKHMS